ncbi:VOC family protein [Viridibacillus sp. FSL R5-0477]|uniref:Glyoxalase family protein n=1 Tax=Viridibacillus arenosi FSL R5-213 TaxID=1227360 RepID=W4ERQ0_9BACL|nr:MULTISPECIES: VOC family protein [Viridibacillus]ETT82697.1 glyoxalase family protein [Viridibacillus arenosi FSL R5-213]OMC82328.1 VOC family protein [Viridibacillus sp. FSL H7-0596]OMC85654.1 VOC family protein [Viridibacillus sp. FSL H8-0123]OMC92231.1 VOC family protein [Viridibacillus arenosi]
MAINVYLNFNGNCREAAEFYAEVFNTEKPEIMTFGDSPQNPEYTLPEEAKDLVMHTRLNILGSNVMFSDVFPGSPFILGNNVSLAAVSDNEEELKSAFEALKVGGKVGMELQETFWSKCYGSLKDKFGIEWQFSHEGEEA